MTKTIPEGITDEDYERGYWVTPDGSIYHKELGNYAIPYDDKYDAEQSFRYIGFGVSEQSKRVLMNKLRDFLETL